MPEPHCWELAIGDLLLIDPTHHQQHWLQNCRAAAGEPPLPQPHLSGCCAPKLNALPLSNQKLNATGLWGTQLTRDQFRARKMQSEAT